MRVRKTVAALLLVAIMRLSPPKLPIDLKIQLTEFLSSIVSYAGYCPPPFIGWWLDRYGVWE